MRLHAVALLGVLALAACGDDDTPTLPAAPPVPIQNWSGTYTNSQLWFVSFERASDGWRSSYTCPGSMTISQGAQEGSSAPIRGFAIVNQPCPPSTFEFTGTVQNDGSVAFMSDGPRPLGCPERRASYSGQFASRQISARASTNIECSGVTVGMHRFDFVVSGYRYN